MSANPVNFVPVAVLPMGSLWRMAVSPLLLLLTGCLSLSTEGSEGAVGSQMESDVSPPSDRVVRQSEAVQWPMNRVVEMPGDLVLGGLHMVHERDDRWVCGAIMPQVSISTNMIQCVHINYIFHSFISYTPLNLYKSY